MSHFAHYVLRRIVEVPYENEKHWWFARNQPDGQGFDAPSYHVTRSVIGPAACVRTGDVIWLFSQLASRRRGALPPALDAKVVVGGVVREPRKDGTGEQLRFMAAAGSRWFPLHDGSSLLADLGITRCVGQTLQSMRRLDSGDSLLAQETSLVERGFDFVSYRLVDGTGLAFKVVQELIGQGRPVFWDRWSLPRRLAERREFIRDETLERALGNAIQACRTFQVAQSPRYGEAGSYTAREYVMAVQAAKPIATRMP